MRLETDLEPTTYGLGARADQPPFNSLAASSSSDVGRLPAIPLGLSKYRERISLQLTTIKELHASHLAQYTRDSANGHPTMSGTKRAASPPASSSKHARPDLSPPRPQSLHAWLHPETPPPLMTHSPPLHESTSTFLSFSISFVAPSHITTDAALTKEARRMVRELNVVGHVGEEIVEGEHGAFTEGAGKITNSKGKERAREPDHRMWAVRTLVLKDGRDGTKGEDDYQVCALHRHFPELDILIHSSSKRPMMMGRSSVERGCSRYSGKSERSTS
jgi:hypothetical protein